MTDPNVLKALKELADAVAWSVPSGLDDNLVKARRCLDRAFTLLAAAEKPAAAPPVAAVKFDANGVACGDGWSADVYYERDGRPSSVVVSIDLRPGEDAGETVAKMLAACGRGP